MTNTKEAQLLLVDSANGIYCWDRLSSNYPLFKGNGDAYSYNGQFNPDNPEWCESIDFAGDLYVKHNNGDLWRIEQIEGDIWAINPDAHYNEDLDTYEVN